MPRTIFAICSIIMAFTLCACGKCVQGNCTNGVGTYEDSFIQSRYTGEFKNGDRHGQGTGIGFYTDKSIVYTGEWANGKPNGLGTFTESGGKKIYCMTLNAQPNGYGIFTWDRVGAFEGMLVQGKRNGFGVLTPSSGPVKSGLWYDNKDIDDLTRDEFFRNVSSSTASASDNIQYQAFIDARNRFSALSKQAVSQAPIAQVASTQNPGVAQPMSKIVPLQESLQTEVKPDLQYKPQNDIKLNAKKSGHAQRRLALVIGNSAYRVSPLKNPANDPQDMAAALRRVGFDVTLVRDATQQQMENAVREFGLKLRQGGTGLFYYAGHGVQVAGENYLVPVNAVIQTEGDVKFGCLPAGLVLAKMEDAGNDVNIVILDACRNNSFSRSFRNADQGLAKMDAPTGSLISYATAPGSVASDGAGRNGLFTQHLLRNIATPGLPITEVFMRVRQGVVQETKKKQVPWESSSLIGQFYFSE